MLERTYSLPEAREWLLRKDNWMSDTVQNEILECFAHAVQRKIVAGASNSHYYGLTADGTTDTASSEQFSCHLYYVDPNLSQQSVFLGFYNPPDTTSETLFLCIKDIFCRLNLPLEKLQGYCFDGASNMSGRFSGVQARLKEVCPGSLYVHCSNHALDLALQEVARDVRLVADALNFVQSVATLIRESAKRQNVYKSFFGDEDVVCNILGLCPTRWCVRTQAISRICHAYGPLLETLFALQQDPGVRGEIRAKVAGLLKQAKKGRTVFGLLCCKAVFGPCEAVARSLQSAQASVSGALQCIHTLKESICALREERAVEEILTKTKTCASANNLKLPPDFSRTSRTPARFRSTTAVEDVVSEKGESLWRREYYEALDLVTSEIERRFGQAGMTIAAQREQILMDSAKGTVCTEAELRSLQLPSNMDRASLHLQLRMLGDLTKKRNNPHSPGTWTL